MICLIFANELLFALNMVCCKVETNVKCLLKEIYISYFLGGKSLQDRFT